MEKLVRNRLMCHLNDNSVLVDNQYGFRERRGCPLQLLTVLEDWMDIIDCNGQIDCLYLDFRKAFDTVPHNRLIQKVEACGIKGNVPSWIKSFLADRTQRVCINNQYSEWAGVMSGIPQGSVLGLVLFVLYINDLPDQVNSTCKLFADDTKLYRHIHNGADHESVQNDINSLIEWSSRWLLLFNVEKCKVVRYGNRRADDSPYYMLDYDGNRVTMEESKEEKDLGILFQSDLKFTKQIDQAANRANRILGIIKRTFSTLDANMLRSLYTTLVRPHLDYGDSVWFPTNKKDILVIENVQRRGTRLLPGLKSLNYEESLRALNLPSLLYRRIRGDLIHIFKIMKGFEDVDSSIFFSRSKTTTRGHSLKLEKTRCEKSIKLRSFGHRNINRWNSLPEHIISSSSIDIFKSKLDKHWEQKRFLTDLEGF